MPNSRSDQKTEIIKKVKLSRRENARAHFTSIYHSAPDILIVRRGQNFKIKLYLKKKLEKIKEDIYVVFQVKDDIQPKEEYGTLIRLKIQENHENESSPNNDWELKIIKIIDNVLTLHIKPAANCPVTKWKLKIQKGSGSKYSYTLQKPIYILFNPWCIDDEVYMEDESHRNEYVYQDTTLLLRGDTENNITTPWRLGQYEENILDCVFYLVKKKGKVIPQNRGNPIIVARALTSAVNSNDNNGVLRGNWSAPNNWTGSTEILKEYYETKSAVDYGQCWVFAGVLGTVLRALGIPTRLVTTSICAHDTYGTLMVDQLVDETGKRLNDLEVDFTWNFHVWCDAWMLRNDLNRSTDGNYDGWQAVDGTPQELSDGMFRLGPASLKAVKNGEILKSYDTAYVYAEVNADIVTWKYIDSSKPHKFLRADTISIGKLICSKAVGKNEMEDVAQFYKYPENTKEERDIMKKALEINNTQYNKTYLKHFKKIEVSLTTVDRPVVGSSFPIIATISNKSRKKFYDVTGFVNLSSVMYNGREMKFIKQKKFSIRVDPQQNESAKMEVSFEDYYPKLYNQEVFNVNCLATIKDTDYEYFVENNFRLLKPKVNIRFSKLPVINEPVNVVLSITNTLPIALHNGNFQINGYTIPKTIMLKVNEIKAGEDFETTFKYLPTSRPHCAQEIIMAKFNSTELDDLDGFLSFEINRKPISRSQSIISFAHLFS